ncbi:ribosome assembly RNA-binding protein YhbY [Enterococcus faecium]|uniref:ribosome assembly RNA-binding protein YhbY n=1 Tax=Enterococcus TaxID=1350 RepID=UPI0008A1B30C|nr:MULTISPECIES: ribosome assembly RNA-binding protein YhbY [Enterococcus]EGP4767326.1 ribosome assembly RNA-binding protein YhbY [Enterococcus faecium]EGP4863574.1 ribosome assembly RNA-binding protein YhbY [Enterococcus faecium]EGP5144842.1 ribosome assembly RNA-binding protein YhbY [Enterococcus faecium]EGP5249552.1 ribosome assembly RNA-binding protein YhbY [Enterococcus faecium]EGP5393070.1 ribosome assembly RNA-binding protein YhbY [Enterococcus faecium]
MSLRGKQKRFLRSKAHHLQPIFQIGKGGINLAMIVQIEEALEKRELIKVSLLQNTDEVAEEAAQVLEKEIDCEIVQIIGRVIVLYKPSTKEKYQRLSNEVKAI